MKRIELMEACGLAFDHGRVLGERDNVETMRAVLDSLLASNGEANEMLIAVWRSLGFGDKGKQHIFREREYGWRTEPQGHSRVTVTGTAFCGRELRYGGDWEAIDLDAMRDTPLDSFCDACVKAQSVERDDRDDRSYLAAGSVVAGVAIFNASGSIALGDELTTAGDGWVMRRTDRTPYIGRALQRAENGQTVRVALPGPAAAGRSWAETRAFEQAPTAHHEGAAFDLPVRFLGGRCPLRVVVDNPGGYGGPIAGAQCDREIGHEGACRVDVFD